MTNDQHNDVMSNLTLGEVAKLQRDYELLKRALAEQLHIPYEQSAYHSAELIKLVARSLREKFELENKVKDVGHKSLSTAVYGLCKSKDTSLIPDRYQIAPEQMLKKAKNKAATQKGYAKSTLPLLNELVDDPQLNEADWRNLDEWMQTSSLDELNAYLYGIKRRELCGEFDEEMQKVKVREVLEQRLLVTQERLGLLPATETKMLAAGAEKKESVEMRFVPTGATTNADKDLGAKQIASLSDEERELYEQMCAMS